MDSVKAPGGVEGWRRHLGNICMSLVSVFHAHEGRTRVPFPPARESRESFKPSQLTSVPRAVRGLNATYGSDEKAKPDVAYSRPLRFDRVARRMRMESLWLDRIHRGYLAALQCFSCHMSSDRAEEASIGMIGTL